MMKRCMLLLASLFVLAMGSVAAYNPYAPNQFDAVERNSWEFKSVYSLAQAGLTDGDMTKLAPSYNLTRYEMTEMVAMLIEHRSKANASQQAEIDKLQTAFATDLSYLEPVQPQKKAEQPQGQKFDWKQGTIAK